MDNPSFAERAIKNITVSKTFDIHATLCVPPNGAKKNLLHLATHGGGYDSRYWNSEIEPEKYSYVKAVMDEGYSILTYDRISTGQSSKPDAYTDVQIPGEVEVLRGVTEIVRSGRLGEYVSNDTSPVTFDKIIHVGHSLGSITTYGLTALYPDLSDAAVLTGFLVNKEIFSQKQTQKGLEYAPENDPALFADSSSGYVVHGTAASVQTEFFSSRQNQTTGIGGFDPKLLEQAFTTRQPEGVVETGSAFILYASAPIAPLYKGPVQFMVGEFDFVVCGGDCRGTHNATDVMDMYPKSPDVDIWLQPGTGHALPFHYGAKAGFQKTFDFLKKNGL